MSNKSLKIAQKFAPVLCCELSKDHDMRIFDCFSSVNFKPGEESWDMIDRVAEFRSMFSFENGDISARDLKPSVYYSLLETESHYFLLYTVYHALDQKSPFGHEHDMEHVQVVVRKGEREEDDAVEFVTTNAHHAYYYYLNKDKPVTPHPPFIHDSHHGKIVLYKDTHPVVYVQPGDGSIFAIAIEEIGHGIFGIGGVYKSGFRFDWSKKWHANISPTFDFENKDGGNTIGVIAVNADNSTPAKPYELVNNVNLLHYELENVEDTIWQWFKDRENNNSLCKKGCKKPKSREDWYRRSIKDPNLLRRILKSIRNKPWKPCLFKEKKEWEPWKWLISGENLTRREYFEQKLNLKKIAHPSGVCGTKDQYTGNVREAGGAWPFEYKNRATGRRFYEITGNKSWENAPFKELDVFFDPAAAYKIMVTTQEPISTDYIDYPYA
jgi:hypothetical protein